jgi:hypothetical protein
VRKQRIILKDHGRIALVRRDIVDASISEINLPLIGRVKPRHESKGRRFPTATGTQERREASPFDLQRNMIDSSNGSKFLGQIDNPDVDIRHIEGLFSDFEKFDLSTEEQPGTS